MTLSHSLIIISHSKAERRFETAGREYVEQTIKLAKNLRPMSRWGYYAFPYCESRWLSFVLIFLNQQHNMCKVLFFCAGADTFTKTCRISHTGFNKGKTANCPAQVQQENDKWVLRSTKLEFRLIELYTLHRHNFECIYAGSVTCFSTRTSFYQAWVFIPTNVN